MAECCDPVPYRRFFNTAEANRRLEKYRRGGLDERAADLVEFLRPHLVGRTVLEVGGGVGELGIELLGAGAVRVTNIELSDAYEPVAAALAAERGLADHIERRIGDFVEVADEVPTADVVVLNRVVCCYPFMERMMRAAADKATRHLGLVYPRDAWWNRAAIAVGNAYTRLRRCGFDAFVHPVDAIHDTAMDAGLSAAHRSRGPIWETAVLARP